MWTNFKTIKKRKVKRSDFQTFIYGWDQIENIIWDYSTFFSTAQSSGCGADYYTLGLFMLRSFKSWADEVMNLSNC